MTSLFIVMEEDIFCETKTPVIIAESKDLADEFIDRKVDQYGMSYTVKEIYPSEIIRKPACTI